MAHAMSGALPCCGASHCLSHGAQVAMAILEAFLQNGCLSLIKMACACRRAAEEASQNLRQLDSRAAAAVKTAKQAASMLKVGHPSSMQPRA